MYTYRNLQEDFSLLSKKGARVGSVGNSVLNNRIYYAHTGSDSGSQIIVTGGIHARENVTSLLVVKQAYRHLNCAMGIYFVPMLNPDGAVLIERGWRHVGRYTSMVRQINGSDDFSLWKANVRGVDLNNNFDAKFGLGKGNLTKPSSHGYIGKYPFSEPESAAIRDFTLKVKPSYTVSYHAKGREVYWYFGQDNARDKVMASKIARYLDYKRVDGDMQSAGGYKDWCVLQGISAVTIEIGKDELSHPLCEGDVAEDIERNLDLPQKIHLWNKNF
ncbi:MAG: hypothetical protein IKC35_03180 [Clostridia bacterium]|nr:hypothetical protein [Clostridia bacterium]